MPRNGAGIYTLPPSNPVIPFTTIATAWANPTLADIADALTDSLSRTGLGGMLVPFRVADGNLAAPGLAFTNETGLGLRRVSAGLMSFVSSGADIFQIQTDRALSTTRLDIRGYEAIMATGFKNWRLVNDGGNLKLQPSISVDGSDWNPVTFIELDPAGNVHITGSLAVDGTISGDFILDDVVSDSVQAITYTGNFATLLQYNITAHTQANPSTINFQLSQSWLSALSAPLTVTSIVGLLPGNIGRITFSGTGNTITWPATVKWPGPTFTQPNLAAGPLDIAVVVLEYDGTNFLANASVY